MNPFCLVYAKAGKCILRIPAISVILLALNLDSFGAEFRGLWVDAYGPGFFSTNQVRKLVADCRKYNFNAVLVEMRRRGDAFYNSNYDPRTTIIGTNFDALAEIIRQCHTGAPRIEVHCWVVSHFIWSWDKPPKQPNHIFNQHPEYLTKDYIGQKYLGKGYYLDPGNPQANLTIYNMARDIVSRYDIDGFHWDYCRYPSQDSGYNHTAIQRFNAEFGLTGLPRWDDPRFSDWRRRQVTDFLRWVNADLLEIRPGLVISVAVFANIRDSYGNRFADWPAWNREGILDACVPMDFSPNNQGVFNPRVDEALINRGIRQVYIGQAAYMNTLENTLAQLNYIRGRGFSGTLLYSYRQPNRDKLKQEQVFSFIKEHFQPAETHTPPLPWKRDLAIIKGTVFWPGTNTPVYNAVVTLGTDPPRTQKTEPHGTYAFFSVRPGRYKLGVEGANGVGATRTVEARGGQVLNEKLISEH